MQNLTNLALAVPEISLWATKFEEGHVAPTTPFFKDDLSFLGWDLTQPTCVQISHSRDMVSTHQNSSGSRDLTTPLSGLWYAIRRLGIDATNLYQI